MIFKKLISTLAFAITACVCSVSAYASSVTTTYYDFSASGSVVNSSLSPSLTNYDFSFLLSSTNGVDLSFVSGTYDGSSVTVKNPSTFGTLNGSILDTVAARVNTGLPANYTAVALALDSSLSSSLNITEYYSNTLGAARTGSNNTYIFQVSGAPEIDGSLAPKVGFLLGCLFLMFGRKKQNSEPMMTT